MKNQELEDFIGQWDDSEECKKAFLELRNHLTTIEDSVIEFLPRPGVTYSLRGTLPGNSKPLFVMVDVIEDSPRWLSVCFYGDMITDPDSHGDLIPGGLLGEDGYCFDMEEYSAEKTEYLKARISEAHKNS